MITRTGLGLSIQGPKKGKKMIAEAMTNQDAAVAVVAIIAFGFMFWCITR